MTLSEQRVLMAIPLLVLTATCTHLIVSCGQTLMHRWLGHRRVGGIFFRNHIKFHHAVCAKGHLVSSTYRGEEGNNTPYFLIPTVLLGVAAFLVLPVGLFLTVALAAAASFYAHVHLDKAYHVKGSWLKRFSWFRRKQQLHFVHHLHSNCNFAVIDFFWDRLLGTYRRADDDMPS
jgi:sterol desaturase/sphingolipid hydroxylase (fatty acid hydroxylase superfamily)